MMRRIAILGVAVVLAAPVFGASLGTASRNVIPGEIQQIISVDYRALRNSPTAMDLKAKVLPPAMKQFETALHSVGIQDSDIEQITFAAYRTKSGLKTVGVAQGQFSTKNMLKKFAAKKIKGEKFRRDTLYPMGGMQMAILDDYTLLFGESAAVKQSLAARDGEGTTLNGNTAITDLISGVESGPIWSVLDTQGTQAMLRSALGDAEKLADYDVIKKRLTASRYQMDFNNGVNFDLDVLTSDSMSAATLSSLLKAAVLLKQTTATGAEKLALDSMSVESSGGALKVHFKTEDKKFESLMQSQLFEAVSR
jgi:hypothetical protein